MYSDNTSVAHSAYHSLNFGAFIFTNKNTFSGLSNASISSASFAPSLDLLEDPSWYIESGATNHITNDLSKLLNFQAYLGSENYLLVMIMHCKLNILDQSCLIHLHLNLYVFFLIGSKPLLLNHILHVPYISKSLLSISKLLTDNPIIVEFLGNLCFIKAQSTGIFLLKAIAKDGLYKVKSSSTKAGADQSSFINYFVFNTPESLFVSCSIFPSTNFDALNSCELNKKSCLSIVIV